jgi:hypothetical protein
MVHCGEEGVTATEQIAQEIRDRISLCEEAIASTERRHYSSDGRIITANRDTLNRIMKEVNRLKERRATLTECLMLVERE